jgi:pimeloyl-ACP methyl ester carboxylesterase
LTPELRTENLGDVDLPYLSYDGGESPLIFLHATGFLAALWHPVARALAPTYRIIAPNIVDYRRADPEKGGLSWITIARDIAAFCEKTRIRKPYLAGHSMGGTVLTLAAALYGLSPKAMVLIEPIFLPPEFYRLRMKLEDHPLASKAVRRKNHWQDASEAMEYLKSRTLFEKWDEEVLKLYVDHGMTENEQGGLRLVCSPRTEAALFMGGVQFDPWPYLPKVKCPVLIVEGEKTENKHFVDIQKAVAAFPDASYRMVPATGHLIPMERPAKTAAIINEYFQM